MTTVNKQTILKGTAKEERWEGEGGGVTGY